MHPLSNLAIKCHSENNRNRVDHGITGSNVEKHNL